MKFEIDKLYYLRFFDHALGSEIVECELCGWVLREDQNSVVVTTWNLDSEDHEVRAANTEPVSIIKSCIIRKRKISIPQTQA